MQKRDSDPLCYSKFSQIITTNSTLIFFGQFSLTDKHQFPITLQKVIKQLNLIYCSSAVQPHKFSVQLPCHAYVWWSTGIQNKMMFSSTKKKVGCGETGNNGHTVEFQVVCACVCVLERGREIFK